MKSLQKLVCMIFLLSIVAAGCKQSISSPSPDDSTDGKVEFSLKDKNGKDVTLSENGSEFSAKVKKPESKAEPMMINAQKSRDLAKGWSGLGWLI
ncbi:MAG: hypothetical protein ACFNX0_08585 [Treponema sp.]